MPRAGARGSSARIAASPSTRSGSRAVAPVELGAQDVEPALDHAAEVGQVDLLLLGVGPELADLGERQALQPLEVVLGQDAVDAAVARTGRRRRVLDAHRLLLRQCDQDAHRRR
jgi:hypothetical protein